MATRHDEPDTRREVEAHYTRDEIAAGILERLADRGVDPSETPFNDVPVLDEMHVRGRAASLELAELATLAGPLEVLDVGSGLGGSARFLAARFGCRVYGIDLTGAFCRAALELSEAFALERSTGFVQGSGTALPFRDGAFPVVWTQHAQMNIGAKRDFYDELLRVLAPGGQLLFHDIFAASDVAPRFPLPWASESSISHLVAAGRVADYLRGHGLQCVEWRDRTLPTIGWLREVVAEAADPNPSTIMGADRARKMANLLHGLETGRLQVIQSRWDRPPVREA